MIDQLPLLDVPPMSAPSRAAPSLVSPLSRAHSPAPAAAPRTVLTWLIDDILIPCYRAIIPVLNVWQWADAGNVFLDEKATATPGYYSSDKTPYIREFVETFTSPDYDEDHVIKSSRVGITEAALCVIRFMPGNCPGQALVALDSTEEAKKVSSERLIPTLPTDAKTDDGDDITRKIIRLRNMVIHISGSYSPTIFRNKWLRFAFLDEIEVVEEIAGEGTLHDLARSRMADVPGAKLFTASKPKKWRSKHHCEVVTGTLSAYLIPCPHCGTFQEITFDGQSFTHQLRIEDAHRAGEPALSPALSAKPPRLGRFRFEHCKDLLGQWDLARIERETYYECVSGCSITNAELKKSVRSGLGRWLATNPRPQPRKRSRHIWDAYSLHDKLSLGHIAVQFVKGLSDPALLMHVFNNHFGMPWRDKVSEIGDEQLLHCREAYPRGTVPFVPDLITTCADSQHDCWKYVTTAYRVEWGADATIIGWERAVVRWGRAGTRAELLEESRAPVIHSTDANQIFHALSGFVDLGGDRSDEVYDLHVESWHEGRAFFFPILGRGWQTKGRVWFSENARHKGMAIRLFFCHDDSFKRSLYLGSIGQSALIKEAVVAGFHPAALGRPARLWIPGVPGDKELREFLDELQAEQLNAEGDWKVIRGKHNDYGDALKYCDVWFEYMLPGLRKKKREELEAAAAAKK